MAPAVAADPLAATPLLRYAWKKPAGMADLLTLFPDAVSRKQRFGEIV